MKLRAAVDANQKEVVAAFRKLGCSVLHLHQLGKGVPDILVAKTRTALVEIKDGKLPPSRRKLTDDENKFHLEWKGQIFVCKSMDDVIGIASRL